MKKDMTPSKVLSVVARYRARLEELKVPKIQMDINDTFQDLSEYERLAHAHYLLDQVVLYVNDPAMWGKANRLFASAQSFLSNAGIYTLKELMDHNRPD